VGGHFVAKLKPV